MGWYVSLRAAWKILQYLVETFRNLQECYRNHRFLQNWANALNLGAALKTESLFSLVVSKFFPSREFAVGKILSMIFGCRISIGCWVFLYWEHPVLENNLQATKFFPFPRRQNNLEFWLKSTVHYFGLLM